MILLLLSLRISYLKSQIFCLLKLQLIHNFCSLIAFSCSHFNFNLQDQEPGALFLCSKSLKTISCANWSLLWVGKLSTSECPLIRCPYLVESPPVKNMKAHVLLPKHGIHSLSRDCAERLLFKCDVGILAPVWKRVQGRHFGGKK